MLLCFGDPLWVNVLLWFGGEIENGSKAPCDVSQIDNGGR